MKKTLAVIIYLSIAMPAIPQTHRKIDAIFKEYSGRHPGAAVAIIEDGQLVFSKGYGMANLESGEKVGAATNFRLASVTKQFTATALMLLVSEGKISLNTSLTEVWENFPAYGEAIQLRHLLWHTSGIPDYEDFVADTAMNPQVRDAQVLEILRHHGEPYFMPGDQFRYSNSGYALLALVVERLSGISFQEFLVQRIFRPLEMYHTLAFVNGENHVAQRAFGYAKKGKNWVQQDQSPTSAVLGDGGIYSNLKELYLWDRALATHTLLSVDLLKESMSPGVLNDGARINYGYGWHLKNSPTGAAHVYHTGSSTSFRNVYYRIPEANASIIVLTNRATPEEEAMVELAEKIWEAWRGLRGKK
jgi:CubicO group peptidase (beta-lactamase class C family)